TKVRPQASFVWIGHKPVKELRSSEMDDRKESADHQREDGDGFGATSDWPAPFGSGDSKNGGDQSAGVGNADPEDEVCDVECPEDRPVDAPDTQPVGELID